MIGAAGAGAMGASHRTVPVRASWATRAPLRRPLNSTSLAVTRTPPFQNVDSSIRHRSRWVVGSRAIRKPAGCGGGGAGTLPGPRTKPVLVRAELRHCTRKRGDRTTGCSAPGCRRDPVRGLNAIGCQLCAPAGAGEIQAPVVS